MKQPGRFRALSGRLFRRKGRNQGEQYREEKEMASWEREAPSGLQCMPYEFSEQYREYVSSFEKNMEDQIHSMKLDKSNGDFKKKELELMSNYEKAYLEGEYIKHKFTNTRIKSRLLREKESYENEVALIDKILDILKMEADDYEKL